MVRVGFRAELSLGEVSAESLEAMLRRIEALKGLRAGFRALHSGPASPAGAQARLSRRQAKGARP